MENSSIWEIDAKGKPDSIDFEISILKSDNVLGKNSYGWFGPNKLLIASCGGPCNYMINKFVWDRHIQTALDLCKILNERSIECD